MFYSFLFLITLNIATISSYETKPNWSGTFNVTPLCNRDVCCCLSGEVNVKEIAYFFMTLSGKLVGQCNGLSTFFLPAIKPSTFSTKLPIVGVMNLSEDSTLVTVESPLGTHCNGRAVRKS
ncbi:unnamed protein product [Adineta ricciae]|uniref:DUF4773 domain-containing protein n=1 Tax=Adineta ricciae TaxID=249248 RepID=A0A815FVJ1_ADIRI|nr:unnamed protein product [Adineta ricciae]